MQAMDLLPYRVWGTDLQAPVFSGGVGRGSLGCTPGLPSIPHLPPWCCAVSERILFCWPPAWASLSILPSERQGGPHRGHPAWRDSCAVCQPCCPSAQGRDILWGLSLVTPPDLPNLSQWPGAPFFRAPQGCPPGWTWGLSFGHYPRMLPSWDSWGHHRSGWIFCKYGHLSSLLSHLKFYIFC